MKTTQGTLAFALILSCLVGLPVHGQNAIQLNGINVTEEGAMRLSWASNSNEVYQVQCADTLIDTNTGTTPWQVLYDQYPSHGTNTFWLDTGNYISTPAISHPKYSPIRFYRILNEETNDGESPSVTINSPTNGSVLSDQVTISVTTTSSYPIVNAKLFVDGQEMNPTLDGTNFIINTCEWPNGAHMLFATATARSRSTGPRGLPPLQIGRAVSAYVPVAFSNLITKIAFSQVYFQPSLGQTQEVTAAFAANVDWTLEIVDDSTNAVRTVTGSGASLVYDWDGTGDGGTNIPDGVYHYQISAETNGGAFSMALSGASARRQSSSISETQSLWVLSPSGDQFPLALYPPEADTNGIILFEASSSEIQAINEAFLISSAGVEQNSAAASGAPVPGNQNALAPSRPSTAPIKNQVNNFLIAYYTFDKRLFPNGRSVNLPRNGNNPPLNTIVHLDGNTGDTFPATFDYLFQSFEVFDAIGEFVHSGWSLVAHKFDANLSVQEIRRSDLNYNGGELFTQATIGIFIDHGDFGNDLDFSAGGSGGLQTYFPSGNPADNGVNTFDNGWLRMCQFGFGGNLKWMVINACNALCDPNYSSMLNKGGIPLKTTHLLCSASTQTWVADHVESEWAKNMISKHELVADAWIDAGKTAYSEEPPGTNNVIVFRITGYLECFGDTVTNNTPPTSPSPNPRNLTKRDEQVYPQ